MAVTSDIVVRAEVVDVKPGRLVPDHHYREVTLAVREVLFSKTGTVPNEIIFEEVGWDKEGSCYIVNGVQWSSVGDQAYYFMEKHDTVDRTYVLMSYEGRLTIGENGSLNPPNLDTSLEKRLAAMSRSELESRVRQASEAFSEGELKPQDYGGAN